MLICREIINSYSYLVDITLGSNFKIMSQKPLLLDYEGFVGLVGVKS